MKKLRVEETSTTDNRDQHMQKECQPRPKSLGSASVLPPTLLRGRGTQYGPALRFSLCVGVSLLLAMGTQSALGGNLDPPPGPIAPTMKPLSDVEPRIAVKTLSGSATALHVISQAGSYYLTENITGGSGKHGIEIQVAGVTLDLNGFELVGTAGSLNGVHIEEPNGTFTQGVRVRNGTISNWIRGISADDNRIRQNVFESLLLRENSQWNLKAIHATIRSCRTDGGGIRIEQGLVVGCAGRGGAVALDASFARISECDFDSPVILGSSMISETDIAASGVSLTLNDDNSVSNVRVRETAGSGGASLLVQGDGNSVKCVTVTDGGITVTGSSNLLVRNHVHGATVPFSIPAGNSFGPIVDVAGAGDLSSVANSEHPLANLAY